MAREAEEAAYRVEILADSISPEGHRLTTAAVPVPGTVHAEMLRHRMFSFSFDSTRAMSLERQIQEVLDNPFIPPTWGSNKRGMQAGEEISEDAQQLARAEWLKAIDDAVAHARALGKLGVHKQHAARGLFIFRWHRGIITATEWDNFLALRDHPNAQPEMQLVAQAIRRARDASKPRPLQPGGWHLPLLRPEEEEWARQNPELARRACIGRVARVSYGTHKRVRPAEDDIALANDLEKDHHMSPFEHIATAMTPEQLAKGQFTKNLRGWEPYRSRIPHEDNFAAALAARG